MNRFAALNLSSDEESDGSADETGIQTSGDHVAYTIKEINWKMGDAIRNLRSFQLQNISKNRNGALFLRFVNEQEAQKVFQHVRQTFKLKFSPLKVPLLAEHVCFHCRREGHWGNECVEGTFLTLPSELYGRILAFAPGWPDKFAFLYTSKKLFKILAPQISEMAIKRPLWADIKKIALKLGVLRSLKNLKTLTLKSLCSKSIITPQMVASLTRLNNLSIVNCIQTDRNPVLTQALLASIGQLTKLTKLDLDQTKLDTSYLPSLTNLSNLTQLRLCFDFGKMSSHLAALTAFGNLKKLAVNYTAQSATNPVPEQLLTKLTCLKIYHHYSIVTLPEKLPALQKLYVSCRDLLGLKSAANLTKLTCYSSSPALIDSCSDRLVSLTMFVNSETGNIKINMPRLKNLVIHCTEPLTVDLQEAICLENLVICDAKNSTKLENAPPSLQEIIVVPSFYMDMVGTQEDWSKFNITSFQLIAESVAYTVNPDHTAQFFAHLRRCSTLRNLKLDSMPEECLVHLTGLTQLKELDLVNNPVVLVDKKQMPQSKILELSNMLPNTRIKYGFEPPTTTKRDHKHWFAGTMNNREYDPYWRCNCAYCRDN